MNKLLFSLSFCLLVIVSSAQTQRLILVEEFTNASCGPCALSNPAFNTLMTNNASKVVCIRNHTSFPGYDPFYTQNSVQNQARTIYYQVTAVPTARMDGSGVFLGDVTQASIDAEYLVAPSFSIKLVYTISSDNDSLYAKATVKALTTISGSLKAHIVVVEKMISFTTPPGSNGEKDFPMVMKKMLPTETGTLLPATMNAGDSAVINVGWLMANVYNINQLAVVSFVQDNNTKNIKQAAYAPTPQTIVPPTPPTITVNTITNAICTNNGAININVSGGTLPYAYHWSNNATTQDVSALAAGNYSVTVTGGTASASANFTVPQSVLEHAVINSISDKTACAVKLNWNLVTDATSYRIKYKQKDSTIWSTPVNVGNVNSYSLNGLKPGMKYNFALAAFCPNGTSSGYSSVVDSTEKCEAVLSSSVTNNSSTSVTFSWTSTCYSIGYRFVYRAVGSATWIAKTCTTTNYTVNTLLPNTTYEYRIRNKCDVAPNVASWTSSMYFTTSAQRVENELINKTALDLLIYPNPNAGSFMVTGSFNENTDKATVEIYNGIGQAIYSEKIALENGIFEFPVSLPAALSNGLYFVNIYSKDEMKVSHLLIQK